MSLSERLGSEGRGFARTEATWLKTSNHTTELKEQVHLALVNNLGKSLYSKDLGESRLREEVYSVITRVIASQTLILTDADRARLVQEIIDDIVGLGPIEQLLRDPDVTEVMVNGPDEVFAERGGRLSKVPVRFENDAHIRQVIERIVSRVGRRVDEGSPMVDARLPDGSRVNAIVPPVAVDGPSVTIRKFSGRVANKNDLIRFGSVSAPAMQFLELAIRGKRNIVISGGTGSGKTTTLNILAALIPSYERIVTIEDSAELSLGQEHVVRLESRPANSEGIGEVTIRDLVRNSLRMRPDRIVVGEVRDAAAFDMLQAMNTGHDGSLSTVHANSTTDCLSRIETMASMSELRLSIPVIREQLASAVDILIHQARFRDGSRKITSIAEIVALENGSIKTQEIFGFEYPVSGGAEAIGRLVATGIIPECVKSIEHRGVEVDREIFKKDL
ncbi:MAG: CpaF family protein [Aquiluna sp.]|nr:CpaF family protein [Aquiluna sp.]MCF8546213.1 CpaF family protein [Aquiluna sp.]